MIALAMSFISRAAQVFILTPTVDRADSINRPIFSSLR